MALSRKFLLRAFLYISVLLAVILLLIGRPAYHLLRVYRDDKNEQTPIPKGFSDDASKLNQTRVAELFAIPSDPASAEQQLINLVARAKATGQKISIAGARHSMGGHTIYPDGIVLDMTPFRAMQLDEPSNILHVQAGARWREIIPYLNQRGRSVEIMQSNDDFTVGGSISVNCHGWQCHRPPIASSVYSFRLLTADGQIVKCSRSENSELFSLALGGYGLFGVILDVDLRVVPNGRYRVERVITSPDQYVTLLQAKANQSTNMAMIYGRFCVAPDNFLNEAVLNLFYQEPGSAGCVSQLEPPSHPVIKRTIFRGSVRSDYGKKLRWKAEKNADPMLSGDLVTRNQLLFEPVSLFQDHSATSTDILVECFVPVSEFASYVSELKKIIPNSGVDLLNVTVRNVNQDTDAFLRYADTNMLALVMLFHQPKTPDAEIKLEKATQQIIAAAIARKGRYYLPYRLHATVEQFQMAYPQSEKFFELKRKYDPDEIFQNSFYKKYRPPPQN